MKNRRAARKTLHLSAQFGSRLIHLNLERIRAAAMIILCFQVLNFWQNDFEKEPLVIIGSVAVSALCLAGLLLVTLMLQKTVIPREGQMLYMGFWMALSAAMLPFYMVDPEFWGMPVNVLLYDGILVVAPIFSMRERSWVFGFQVFTLILAWHGAKLSGAYYLYAVACVLSGYFLSYIVHQNYITVTAKLESEAKIDFLTQVANRKYGYEQANILWQLCRRHKRKFAAIAVDIDYFKAYNDTFGHYEGDKVLKKIAAAIKHSYGRASDIVCRTGGEEFLVCISVSEEKDAMKLAYRMKENIMKLKIEAARKTAAPVVTVSVGVSLTVPQGEETMVGILHEADHMLYQAKDSGRNCVVYRDRVVTEDDF